MSQESSDYNPQFGEQVESAVVGEGNIIYNYIYYRQDDKSVDEPETDEESLPCPYQGLFPFEPEDAEFFFGRDVFIEELYQATKERNVIPVLGASGSGKSSVVLAGLVPKLQQERHWRFTYFRPQDGNDLFHALALALVPLYASKSDETERMRQARQLADMLGQSELSLSDVFYQIQQNHPNEQVILIGDQFEEIYIRCQDTATRRQFLEQLFSGFNNSQSCSPVVLVLTMRADFLDNALSDPTLAEQLRTVDLKIRTLNREELADVIKKPADQVGVHFEQGLVERIIEDVEQQPGNLALLEFALTELWQKREGKQLTHEGYEAIGAVEGALARYADETYNCLPDTDQEKARRVLIQLLNPGQQTQDTQRIATKSELGEENWSLVKQLADARLVVTTTNANGQETVEVVHEALIQNWEKLQAWMEQDREFRAWQQRLRSAKEQWEQTNRDRGSLLQGAALIQAEEKLQQRPEDLTAEAEFIRESIKQRDCAEREKALQQRRKLITACGIALGSIIGGLMMTAFWLEAKEQKQRALQQQQETQLSKADSLARYALSLHNEGKELDAFLPAIQAGKIIQNQQQSDPQVMDALTSNLYHSRARNRLEGHQGWVNSVNVDPNNELLASASHDGTIKLWDLETGEQVNRLEGHQGWVNSVDFDSNGELLASGSKDKTIKLWDVESGKQVTRLEGHQGWVNSVKVHPNGELLASGSKNGTIKLWNLNNGEDFATLNAHDEVNSLDFSPNGELLASGSADGTLKFWDPKTGNFVAMLNNNGPEVNSVHFDPNGEVLAANFDNQITLWNVKSQQKFATIPHDATLTSVKFSPNGNLLAFGSEDGTVTLWDLVSGEKLDTLKGYQKKVTSLDFSSDGKVLVSGSADETIQFWDVASKHHSGTLSNHQGNVTSVDFQPNGNQLASGSTDNTIKLWDVENKNVNATLKGHNQKVTSLEFHPNGNKLASGSADTTIKLWHIKNEQIKVTLKQHQEPVTSLDFHSNGKLLASSSSNGTINLWDGNIGYHLYTLESPDSDQVNHVEFHPHDEVLLSVSPNKTILWDVNRQKPLGSLDHPDEQLTTVSFSPNGKILASGSENGTVQLWDVENRKPLDVLGKHNYKITSLTFSSNGNRLASVDDLGTIHIWNVNKKEKLATISDYDSLVRSLKFNPDNENQLAFTQKETIKVWNVTNLDFLLHQNCQLVRPYLEHNRNIEKQQQNLCQDIGNNDK